MNNLTNEIVKHIFVNFGLTNERSMSIISDGFLTDYKMNYDISDEETGETYSETSNVWAAEAISSNVKINVVCTKLGTIGSNGGDFAMIVYVDKCPTYGCYLELFEQNKEWHKNNGLIAFTMNDKKNVWLKADAYVQFTFAAGLEHFKDLMLSFSICKNPKPMYEKLVSFVKYVDELDD
jgi:hypothetical protein